MVFSSDERISTFRSKGMIGSGRKFFSHGIPFGYKFKNTHLTFGFILRGQLSRLNFLFFCRWISPPYAWMMYFIPSRPWSSLRGLEGFSVLKSEGELVYENPVTPPLEIDWIWRKTYSNKSNRRKRRENTGYERPRRYLIESKGQTFSGDLEWCRKHQDRICVFWIPRNQLWVSWI